VSLSCDLSRLLFRGGLVVVAAVMFAAAGAVLAIVPAVCRPGAGRLGLRRSRGILRRGFPRKSGLPRGRNNRRQSCENQYNQAAFHDVPLHRVNSPVPLLNHSGELLTHEFQSFQPADDVALVRDNLRLPDEGERHQPHCEGAESEHEAHMRFGRWNVKHATDPSHGYHYS
jgi:hypothetical protein